MIEENKISADQYDSAGEEETATGRDVRAETLVGTVNYLSPEVI